MSISIINKPERPRTSITWMPRRPQRKPTYQTAMGTHSKKAKRARIKSNINELRSVNADNVDG